MNPTDLTAKTPRQSAVEMTEMVLPNDANIMGHMLGGRLLHHIDIAAAMAAIRHAGNLCVTASFDSVDFLTPIDVGEVCVFDARVTWTGRTSIEVKVDVYAEELRTRDRRHATTAFTTFVALDPETDKPTLVPPLQPETDEERRLFESGAERREQRMARRHPSDRRS